MKVICPKCQFENQVDLATASPKTRVVCARCATIIEARLSDEAPLGNSNGQATFPPLAAGAAGFQSLTQGRDLYATRIEPEVDEILEIPRLASVDYQASEPAPVFDDLFAPEPDAPPPQDFTEEEAPLDFEEDRGPLSWADRATAPLAAEARAQGVPAQAASEEEEGPLELPAETLEVPPAGEAGDYEFREQGLILPERDDQLPPNEPVAWPVLSEDPYEADRGLKSSIIGRKGDNLFKPVALAVLAFGGLVFAAWYFLGDQLARRGDQNQVAVNSPAPSDPAAGQTAAPAVSAQPTAEPSVAPSVEPKAAAPAESKPADQAAPAAEVKNNRPATETPAPPPAAAKANPEPKPAVPAQAAKPAPKQAEVPLSGHSVKQSEGSITIQISSHSDLAQATERANRLKAEGVEARVVKAEIPRRGTWYRVQLGRFTSRDEASRYASQLRARGAVRDFYVTAYQPPQ